MEISYRTHENVLTAFLRGELDEYTAEHVRISLDTLLRDLSCIDEAKLVLDFSNVSFMDSTGIGVLLGRYNKFKKNDINIYIKNPIGHVDRILRMTGIYELMPKIG